MDEATVSLTWPGIVGAIVGLALTSGIVTTGLSIIVDWFRSERTEKRNRERAGTYLATRLATSLERFAIECADVVGRNAEGGIFKTSGSLPKFPEFPIDADWKALDPALAAEVMSMPNELMMGELAADAMVQISGDPDDLYETVGEQAGKCGHRAVSLASRLRERYKLPRPDFGARHWDFENQLKEKHDAHQALVEGRYRRPNADGDVIELT